MRKRKELGGVEAVAPAAVDIPNRFLDVRELAARLRLSPISVRRAIVNNEIPTVRIGSALRFDWNDVVTKLKSGK